MGPIGMLFVLSTTPTNFKKKLVNLSGNVYERTKENTHQKVFPCCGPSPVVSEEKPNPTLRFSRVL
jgi:hypothetical protein